MPCSRGYPWSESPSLVRAENTAAFTAYLSWGFQVVGQMQPFDDSPLYEAMLEAL
jgi:hypothetical protein